MELTQKGLIDQIITEMKLGDATSTKTPAEHGTLPKDVDGDCFNVEFNYVSIVGILLYLLGHSRPELAFSVS